MHSRPIRVTHAAAQIRRDDRQPGRAADLTGRTRCTTPESTALHACRAGKAVGVPPLSPIRSTAGRAITPPAPTRNAALAAK